MTNPHDSYEPSAGSRATAQACRDMYLALIKEGFTEAQALHIVGVTLTTSIQNQKP